MGFGIRHSIQFARYFVADFYCHTARLVVELDGSSHNSIEQQMYDINRTYILEEFGVTVMRFQIDDAAAVIKSHSTDRKTVSINRNLT